MLAQNTQNTSCVDLKNDSGTSLDELSSQNNADSNWIRDARQTMRDAPINYFKVKAHRYWIDFLFSLVCAYTASTVFLLAPLGSLIQIVTFPLSVFWLYRLGSLVHEVCHLGQHELRGFKATCSYIYPSCKNNTAIGSFIQISYNVC